MRRGRRGGAGTQNKRGDGGNARMGLSNEEEKGKKIKNKNTWVMVYGLMKKENISKKEIKKRNERNKRRGRG